MYFIANENQDIIAQAHSFVPTEPPQWKLGQLVHFEIDQRISTNKICVCAPTGNLWFVRVDNISFDIGDHPDRFSVGGNVIETGTGNPERVGDAIKKYIAEIMKIVKMDYSLIADLEKSGYLPDGIDGICRKFLDDGKRIFITGAEDGIPREVLRVDNALQLAKLK